MATKKQTEKGSAHLYIDLTKGDITVYHGSNKKILYKVKNVEEGSWDKIWKAIRSIKSVK